MRKLTLYAGIPGHRVGAGRPAQFALPRPLSSSTQPEGGPSEPPSRDIAHWGVETGQTRLA